MCVLFLKMGNKAQTNSYQHILKYTSLFGGMQGLNILIGVVRTKLVALILGTEGMGLVSLFNSTVSFINSGTNLGLPTSSVKTLSEAFEHPDMNVLQRKVKVIRSLSLFSALLGMAVCLLLSSLFDMFAFSWGSHRLHYAMLSPLVGMMALVGGEMAILKSVRKLKQVALVSLINMIAALFISVPIYYFMGQRGIIPALTLMTFMQLMLTLHYSRKIFPLEYSLDRSIFAEGGEMIRLGMAFLVSGLFTTGADFVIRSYLSKYATLEVVGLFNAGFMITSTYAGMVFTAMETDYFPRLSGVNHDVEASNLTVNRQIEVTFLLLSPMLALFMVFMPLVLPMLYSSSFSPAVIMAQVVVLSLYFRALKLPVAYLTLAKADSWCFLMLEAYSAILTVAVVLWGYHLWGLEGTGWGLLLAEFVDWIVINVFARFRYRYGVTSQVLRYAAIQLPLALLTFLSIRFLTGVSYWVVGILLSGVSLAVTLFVIHKKTSLWNSLVTKIHSRFNA